MKTEVKYSSDLTNRTMAVDPAVAATQNAVVPSADRPATNNQCDSVRGSQWLPAADAAPRLSELEHAVRRFLALAR